MTPNEPTARLADRLDTLADELDEQGFDLTGCGCLLALAVLVACCVMAGGR